MKKQLGQFFTTNSDRILQGLDIFVFGKNVIDPFAGNSDLLDWAKRNKSKSVLGYDIDKKLINNKNVFYNDSISNKMRYDFVCTNPPYLHKNKADIKTKNIFNTKEHSNFEDLYQLSIFSIMECKEGILIVPLNFLSAENSKYIRNIFFNKFEIIKLNIWTEQVFDDTTYNVIAFHFRTKENTHSDKNIVETTILPANTKTSFILKKETGWQIGGEFVDKIKKVKNNLGIFRLTENDIKSGSENIKIAIQNVKDRKEIKIDPILKKKISNNILYLKAIDSKNGDKIQLEDIRKYDIIGLVGKDTSRSGAHLIFEKYISIKEQLDILETFNKILEKKRKEYLSFFLTNFRDNNRKRISFDTTYKLINYIYAEKNKKQLSLF